jgi:hypothetical protein
VQQYGGWRCIRGGSGGLDGKRVEITFKFRLERVTRSLCAITGPSAELGDIDDPGRKKGNLLEKNKRAKGTLVATYLNTRSSLEAASFSPTAHLAE